jgi:hypothetical protein
MYSWTWTISSSFDFAQDKSRTKLRERGVWPLRAALRTNPFIAKRKGSFVCVNYQIPYNRPSPAKFNLAIKPSTLGRL